MYPFLKFLFYPTRHKLTLDAIPDVNSTAKNKRRRKR